MIHNNTKQFTSWHETLLKFLRGLITSTNVWLLNILALLGGDVKTLSIAGKEYPAIHLAHPAITMRKATKRNPGPGCIAKSTSRPRAATLQTY